MNRRYWSPAATCRSTAYRPSRPNRSAFTLAEVVTVAVLTAAVLMASVPVLTSLVQAHRSSRRTSQSLSALERLQFHMRADLHQAVSPPSYIHVAEAGGDAGEGEDQSAFEVSLPQAKVIYELQTHHIVRRLEQGLQRETFTVYPYRPTRWQLDFQTPLASVVVEFDSRAPAHGSVRPSGPLLPLQVVAWIGRDHRSAPLERQAASGVESDPRTEEDHP